HRPLCGVLKNCEQCQQQQNDDHPEGEIAQVRIHTTTLMVPGETPCSDAFAHCLRHRALLFPASRLQRSASLRRYIAAPQLPTATQCRRPTSRCQAGPEDFGKYSTPLVNTPSAAKT